MGELIDRLTVQATAQVFKARIALLEARLAAAEAALAKADARWREVIRARHIKVDVSHNAYGEGISECGWCGGIWRTVGDDEADGHDEGCPAAPGDPPHA
jgi:hypothetical protein